jgi:hypothetical protein
MDQSMDQRTQYTIAEDKKASSSNWDDPMNKQEQLISAKKKESANSKGRSWRIVRDAICSRYISMHPPKRGWQNDAS